MYLANFIIVLHEENRNFILTVKFASSSLLLVVHYVMLFYKLYIKGNQIKSVVHFQLH